ncbi:MAG: Rrf2 family transcriptional regulator [Chitinophagales bacterium]|nr:Rrf2 family transcriptional regulator [Chitinophagales bacterium]
MLSQTSKIAIKAVIYLCAKSEDGEMINVKEIAESINASEHTVGKALQLLAKRDIINSYKGPNGGFFIDVNQREQPIYDIVETIEGTSVFCGCGLGLSRCSATHPCPIHHDYKVVREMIEKIFREKKIKDLCEVVTSGFAFLDG